MNTHNKLITILGPTAVGKTKFAAILAYRFNGEIISADSRQVYRSMDIGTGKDFDDYSVNNEKIRSHLIDVIEPSDEFNLYLYKELFKKSFTEIVKRKNQPFLVGGTGMYLSSILQKYQLNKADFESSRAKELYKMEVPKLSKILMELNPNLHNTTDILDKERIVKAILVNEADDNFNNNELDLDHLVLGIKEDRAALKNRIRERLKKRLNAGMVEEAQKLLDSGISHEKLRFFGLEYKYLSMYLSGELNYNDMYQKLASSIIDFAKRQMTWFRKMEREGVIINWFTNKELNSAGELVKSFIKKNAPA